MSKSNKSKKNEISLGTAITLIVIIAVIIVAIIIITTKIANRGNEEIGEANAIKIADAQGEQSGNEDVDERKEVVEEYVNEQENGQKVNISEKFKEARTFEGLTVEGAELTSQNSQTHFIANIKNETSKDIDAIKINIILLDKDEKEIVTLGGEIPAIKAGATTQLDIASSLDYANAYDFKIEKRK